MAEHQVSSTEKRSIWMRGLLMILMGLAYQLAGTVLCFIALIQFVIVLVSDGPNPRLSAFGSNVGRFQGQIASFVSFAREDLPYPFSDWPSGD